MRHLFAILLVFAFAVVNAEVWDFTKGCPDGAKPMKGAKFEARGLVSSAPFDMSLNSGCQLTKPYDYPEAFSLEMDLVTVPLPSGRTSADFVMWDDMYVTGGKGCQNKGLQLCLKRNGDVYTPHAFLGVGDKTLHVTGPAGEVKSGTAAKFVFRYDANGGIGWQIGDTRGDTPLNHFGKLPRGPHATKLGDRIASNDRPYDGVLTRVEAKALVRQPFSLMPYSGRLAFERGEADAKIRFTVRSFTKKAVDKLRFAATAVNEEGKTVAVFKTDVPTIGGDGCQTVEMPVETHLRPGKVVYTVSLTAEGHPELTSASRTYALTICRTFNPERMPASMWGYNGFPPETVVNLGFTHGLAYGLGWRECPNADVDTIPVLRLLDKALEAGLRVQKPMSVEYPGNKKSDSKYHRLKPDGSLARGVSSRPEPVPEVSNPEFRAQARKTALRHCEIMGDHPAFCGVLTSSEGRDDSIPSFNHEAAYYEKETGRKVPDEVAKWGRVAHWKYVTDIKKYPNGIVPEDDPVLAYYRWFWKGGDGWPGYCSAAADAYREGTKGRKSFWSFWDPAVRCPPVWGAGGSVDYLNQWIYAVPEPMNVAASAEEMFAMAAGRPGQQVQMMTQLICYRSQIAPSNVVVSPEPQWLKKRPRAGFPSIPPDSLTEATWSMLAKPVKGIQYHGWGTIVETGSENGYTYTNPETTVRLKDLLENLVAPLGPALLHIGRDRGEVAVFESATTALLGGPASWGWMTPALTFAQRARLDPRVIYEETILRDGFGDFKVVYAPQCRYLTQKIVDALKGFQAKGGILVGDEEMTKALKPDIVVPVISFKAPASDHPVDVDDMEAKKTGDVKTREDTMRMKGKMQQDGEILRRALHDRGFRSKADSSSPEIVTYYRSWRETPYVFALNDKRTFGDYVGQWGKTMEKGLPFSGSVSLSDPNGKVGAVYELSRGGQVAFSRADGRVTVPVEYKTNDGRLFAFLPEAIEKVKLATCDAVGPGGKIRLRFSVLGKSGKAVPAALPVEIHVADARGRELDGAGYAAAVDGVCEYSLVTNVDDAEGDYTILCRDRASGLTATGKIARGRKLGWWEKLKKKVKGTSL